MSSLFEAILWVPTLSLVTCRSSLNSSSKWSTKTEHDYERQPPRRSYFQDPGWYMATLLEVTVLWSLELPQCRYAVFSPVQSNESKISKQNKKQSSLFSLADQKLVWLCKNCKTTTAPKCCSESGHANVRYSQITPALHWLPARYKKDYKVYSNPYMPLHQNTFLV